MAYHPGYKFQIKFLYTAILKHDQYGKLGVSNTISGGCEGRLKHPCITRSPSNLALMFRNKVKTYDVLVMCLALPSGSSRFPRFDRCCTVLTHSRAVLVAVACVPSTREIVLSSIYSTARELPGASIADSGANLMADEAPAIAIDVGVKNR